MTKPEDVLSFWLDEIGPAGWYKPDETLDEKIRDRFLTAWKEAQEGAYALWLTYPSGALAYLVLTDQFPRNIFRNSGMAYATDKAALAAAKAAIGKGWDMRIDSPARQFFYMPLMHSENLCDQDRCVRLFRGRMPGENLVHARAHRDVIRKFGRFPYRNEALARTTSGVEKRYLEDGGYSSTLQVLQAKEVV
jgi:uncharacterized protein (DUF924 family)